MENIKKYTFIKQGVSAARSLLITSLLVSAFGCNSNRGLDDDDVDDKLTKMTEEKRKAEDELITHKEKAALLKKEEEKVKKEEEKVKKLGHKITKKEAKLARLVAEMGDKDVRSEERC